MLTICRTEGPFDEWFPAVFEALEKLLHKSPGELEDANARPYPRIRLLDATVSHEDGKFASNSGQPSRSIVDLPHSRHDVMVKVNRRMTAEDWYQDVRHIELELEEQIEYGFP